MQCISPVILKHKEILDPEGFSHFKVPCGKCVNCVKTRSHHWSFRLEQELKHAESAAFLTLTYDDLNIPVTDSGKQTLVKKHPQLWMKRLRKKNAGKIKYYTIGEYGSKTERPHYHSIIFNLDEKFIQPEWNSFYQIWEFPKLQETWNHGHVHCGDVTTASIRYVTGYLQKHITQGIDPREEDRVREFNLMSKGLGQSYLTPGKVGYYKRKLNPYLVDQDGVKLSMPRYYKDKIYDRAERCIVQKKSLDHNNEVDMFKGDTKKEFEYKKNLIYQQERKNALKRNQL